MANRLTSMRPKATSLAKTAAFVAALIVSTAAPGKTQSPIQATNRPNDTDWAVATGNQFSQRYAPLDQINASNVDQLGVAWTWSSPDNALREANKALQSRRMAPGSHEVTPLKVGNRLYVTTGYSQAAAIDPATGQNLFTYDPESYSTGRPPNLGFVHRGATYWTDTNGVPRLFYATGNAFLHAVDATTGEPISTFGQGGSVDLTLGMRRKVPRRAYGNSSPAIACNGVVIVGSSISDGASKPESPPGDVRGFDATTGEQLWTFHSVPQEGEFGNDTWLDGSWEYTGNTNVWTLMSADEDLGLVYLPFGTPTNDWYGGMRKGDNLFGETLVALDCKTGERRWHFQTTHHGVWDYDLVSSAVLGDVVVDGKEIKGAFQVSKQGFVYAFDRATGEPIWPIVERPVPQSTVEDEQTSKTQPFPTKPPPFEMQGMSERDLIDFTPELHLEAKKILAGFDFGPLYTPPNAERPTLNIPGWAGGSSWQGASFDPETGMLYVPSFTLPVSMQLAMPDPARSAFKYVGRINPRIEGPQGLPLIKPPWARITAYDMNKGEIVWMIPLGDGPKDHPALKDLDLPPLGSLARSHVLVTKTLLFVNSGAGIGRNVGELANEQPVLRVFNKSNGELLREIGLPAHTDGTPATYMHNGRQYIVFALGGSGQPQELIAFALNRG